LVASFLDRTRARGSPNTTAVRRFEQVQPAAEDSFEVVSLEPVPRVASFAPNADDAGVSEDAQVAGCRRPAVHEPFGEIARWQFRPEV
jgi:hypothetical protein